MTQRIVSVGDDFALPAGTKVLDTHLPARLGTTALNATIASTVAPLVAAAIANDVTLADAVEEYIANNGVQAPASGPEVVWIGDSLSAQGGSTGQNPAGFLSSYTGITVLTDAVGGETATAIAARVGAMPYHITPAGGTIPASGGVTITLTTPDGITRYPLLQTNGNPALAKTFVGRMRLPGGAYVHGTITLTQPSGASSSHQVDDYYTFTRTTSGSAINVTRPAPFFTDFSEAHRNAIYVIALGRNDVVTSSETDVSAVAARVLAADKAVVEFMESANKRYLVAGVHNGTNEGIGTLVYDKVMAVNKAKREQFGGRYLDQRYHMMNFGLAEAGITPTSDDSAAIADGRVPPSLMTDGLHYGVPARQVYGKLAGDRFYELEWLTVTDLVAPSAPTGLASSAVGATSFNLSWTASTDNIAVTGYDVYLDGVLKTSVTGTSANVTGVSSSTTYAVTVKAKDDAGNHSAASTALNVTTQVLVTDDFNRADSATVGGVWAANANWKIASNKLTRAAASGTPSILACSTAMSTPNHKASAVINRGTATTTGVLVRRIDDNNYYAVRINLAQNNALLYKVVGGVTTSLSGLDNQWLTEGATLTLEIIGTALKAYINGVQILSTVANDAALTSGTGVGLRADAAGGTLPTFDNFAAESFA